MFLENHRDLGVKNGTLATVEEARKGELSGSIAASGCGYAMCARPDRLERVSRGTRQLVWMVAATAVLTVANLVAVWSLAP